MQTQLPDGRWLVDGVVRVMPPEPTPPPRVFELKLRHQSETDPCLTATSTDLKKLLAFQDAWHDYILVTLR